MSDTYAWVDRARDVRAAVDWQDRIASWPAVAAYKARTHELLGAHRPVLDVGAGTGVDLIAIDGASVGIDRSLAMCRTARERGVDVAAANARLLPFRADSFGAARTDRVLQHLEDPDATVAEMVRVVRPGGRVVLAEPDQGSLVIEVPGASSELVERVTALRRDRGYRHGRLARRLPAIGEALGLIDITVDAFPLVLTNPDDAFGLPTWVGYWRDEGPFSPEDEAAWSSAMDQARARPGFVYSLTYFVVSATVAG